MNPISGPSTSMAMGAILTNAPVMPVRALASNARRAQLGSDVYEPSPSEDATPAVTYGRNGRMAGTSAGRG
ncbi:MAG TPA: hypothetical protein VMH61_06875 [Candidatus Acidoferrales bacterium]|nr:hypothetical protein [Candidatus Acidoferrales bacterium]